jgi:hypothetical protein
LATVLAKGSEHSLPDEAPSEFAPSPRFFSLPKDCAVIWRELGKLVLAITRGRELVYFQALSSREIDDLTAAELRCVLLQLHGQGGIGHLEKLWLWLEDCTPEAAEALGADLAIETGLGRKPAPILPDEASRLVPTEVAARKKQERKRRQLKMVGLALAAVYLVALGLWVGDYARIELKARSLQAKVEAIAPEVEWIYNEESRFIALEPTFDVENYPVKTFLGLYEKMPNSGIRFKEIDITPEQVYVSGEASSQPVGLRYQSSIRSSNQLENFDWTAPQPTPNRQGRADFKLTGKPKQYGGPQS